MQCLNLVQQYRADIAQFPRTTSEEVCTLVQRIATAQVQRDSPQETTAKQRLLEGHYGLVIVVAYEVYSKAPLRHLKIDDLIQEGNIGLLKAVRDYPFAQATGHFTPYAKTCIKHTIISALPLHET